MELLVLREKAAQIEEFLTVTGSTIAFKSMAASADE
jgi:hypothetical protein